MSKVRLAIVATVIHRQRRKPPIPKLSLATHNRHNSPLLAKRRSAATTSPGCSDLPQWRSPRHSPPSARVALTPQRRKPIDDCVVASSLDLPGSGRSGEGGRVLMQGLWRRAASQGNTHSPHQQHAGFILCVLELGRQRQSSLPSLANNKHHKHARPPTAPVLGDQLRRSPRVPRAQPELGVEHARPRIARREVLEREVGVARHGAHPDCVSRR